MKAAVDHALASNWPLALQTQPSGGGGGGGGGSGGASALERAQRIHPVQGWFSDTMPQAAVEFAKEERGLSFLRCDGDMYVRLGVRLGLRLGSRMRLRMQLRMRLRMRLQLQ